jgi:hypothetical protein
MGRQKNFPPRILHPMQDLGRPAAGGLYPMGTALSCAEAPPVHSGHNRSQCPGFRCAPPSYRASAGAAGCWVQCVRRRAPGALALSCLRRFLSAVLRIIVPAPAPSSPSFVGACGRAQSAPALLRRLFPTQISRPLPFGWSGPPSGTATQASPAGKKQRGRRGSWPVTDRTPPTTSSAKDEKHHD